MATGAVRDMEQGDRSRGSSSSSMIPRGTPSSDAPQSVQPESDVFQEDLHASWVPPGQIPAGTAGKSSRHNREGVDWIGGLERLSNRQMSGEVSGPGPGFGTASKPRPWTTGRFPDPNSSAERHSSKLSSSNPPGNAKATDGRVSPGDMAWAVLTWLHDGKRWKWESWIILGYVVFLGVASAITGLLLSNRPEGTTLTQRLGEDGVVWQLVTLLYVVCALGSFLPVLHAVLKPGDYSKTRAPSPSSTKTKIDPFVHDRALIESNCKRYLRSHVSSDDKEAEADVLDFVREYGQKAIQVRRDFEGSLVTWAKWARQHRLFRHYTIIFQALTSIAIPLLSQLTTGTSRLLLTVVSTHSGVLLALWQVLHSDEKFRMYRIAESDLRDCWRQFLYAPWKFNQGEDGHFQGDSPSLEGEKGPPLADLMDRLELQFASFVEAVETVREFGRKIETEADRDATTGIAMPTRPHPERQRRQKPTGADPHAEQQINSGSLTRPRTK